MKTTITTAQAMSHPDVALTINTLGQMADGLREERDALKDAARLALDALEESFDTVSNAYMEAIDIWGHLPPMQHRINALKEQSDKHSASIAALKAVL